MRLTFRHRIDVDLWFLNQLLLGSTLFCAGASFDMLCQKVCCCLVSFVSTVGGADHELTKHDLLRLWLVLASGGGPLRIAPIRLLRGWTLSTGSPSTPRRTHYCE